MAVSFTDAKTVLEAMPVKMIQDPKLPGKALYDAVVAKLSSVNDEMRYPSNAGGCFAKGTRVHTKDGLKPIEDVKELVL